MSLFRRLFPAKGKTTSQLNDFLSGLTPGVIMAQASTDKDPELRATTLISLLVLRQSGRFARELFATLAQAPVPVSTSLKGAARFDAVVFETAAFVHFALLAKHLRSPDDEDDEDYEGSDDDEDPYFVAVRDAMHLTGEVLGSLVAFAVNEQIFANRSVAYSMNVHRKGAVQMFEEILVAAIQTASPATMGTRGISLDIGLNLIVSLEAKSFALTMLPTFEQVTRNAVENPEKLGFE